MAIFTLRLVDWGTTLDIAKNPDQYSELNPLLGLHPSVRDVNIYFVLTTIIHPMISYNLSKEYRKAFQYISMGTSGVTVFFNLKAGLNMNF